MSILFTIPALLMNAGHNQMKMNTLHSKSSMKARHNHNNGVWYQFRRKLSVANVRCQVSSSSENAARYRLCRCRHKFMEVRQQQRVRAGFQSAKAECYLFFRRICNESTQGLQQQCQIVLFPKKSVQARRALQKESIGRVLSAVKEKSYVLQTGSLIESKEANGKRILAIVGGLCGNRIGMTEDQVNALREGQAGLSEVVQKQLETYVTAVKAAMSMPFGSKPTETSWQLPDYFSEQTKALKEFALSACTNDREQQLIACEVLDALGLPKSSTAAVDVLIGMGVFPFHVNLDLLKSGLRVEFSDEILAAADALRSKAFSDADMKKRVNLTNLKVYCIDPEDAEEIDDGLSATQLSDGCIKLWIHVSDPTSWITPESCLEKEARRRGTSIYLPTQTLPMFPMELVTSCLSFRQGVECVALSIIVFLKEDGSIAESTIECSTIRPTYKLSYHQASELIFMKLEEENELSLLGHAATLRRQWRKSQGAMELSSYPPKVMVTNAESLDPSINIVFADPTNPAVELVSEMMILCGEAVSMFGYQNSLVLPYRGQLPTNLRSQSECPKPHHTGRDIALHQITGPVDVNLRRPLAHSFLGLAGYVQFTSPIRRYNDFLAHYQVKAALLGGKPLFTHSYMAAAIGWANKMMKEAKELETVANRYWILEYLRRQPRDKLFIAYILCFKKDREALVLLKEIGFEAAMIVYSKAAVGSEIKVTVKEAQPRKGVLILVEVL
ncbi:hypothetical protein O6H91_Y132400 [Diphasiastrum complanatum]|nr:hypothetical protein O6H91_Y132400 [Diphasiastrum complanatum]KAJ7296300.1 hypothetical protein O6H91_Y132400 [Diphasiastrum complanatum]KAJ7296301.1 hypothetical protein O6H91_Y132400 [Diphasiastrum complanatum]